MDTFTVVAGFLRFVGEVLADLAAKTLAEIDIDLLSLKRTTLAEKLDDFTGDLSTTVKQEKGRVEQDMISRGLGNTTIRLGKLASIDEQAATDTERATREYNRAIKEIALLERKVREQNDTGFKKIVRYFRRLFEA